MTEPVNDSLSGIGDRFGITGDFSDSQRRTSRNNQQGHDVGPVCNGLYVFKVNQRTIHELIPYFAICRRGCRQGGNGGEYIKQFHMPVAGLIVVIENAQSTGQRALSRLAAKEVGG